MAYLAGVSLMQSTQELQQWISKALETEGEEILSEDTEDINNFKKTVRLIESLYKEASLVQEFFKNFHLKDTDDDDGDENAINILESRIIDLAHKAESFINAFMYDCALSEDDDDMEIIQEPWDPNLEEILEEIQSINKELKNVYCKKKFVDKLVKGNYNSSVAAAGTSLTSRRVPNAGGGDIPVGLDEDILALKDRLTNEHPSHLTFIPIIGMGGIGKTTLATYVYNDPFVMDHFYIRAWTTVSQKYHVRYMLEDLLQCVTGRLAEESNEELGESNEEELGESNEELGESDQKLGENLYRNLKGRRYLIVLDDLWDTEAWDGIRRFFPDDRNGSRIMLTSRLKDVGDYVSHDSDPHLLRFLSADTCWGLLHSRVFKNECCPRELELIGRQIARNCCGLPLIVVVVAGFLSKMSQTQECWVQVAKSISPFVNQDPQHCLDILALSYKHLPHHLRACFLYFGAFPEDFVIPVWKLKQLWIAEGFVQPSDNGFKSLEEVAEQQLQDLIDRGLIQAKRRDYDDRVKTCYIHDSLRELCLREAKKAKFLQVIKWSAVPKNLNGSHRLIFQDGYVTELVHLRPTISLTRTLMCFRVEWVARLAPYIGVQDFKLLRVLDIMAAFISHSFLDFRPLVNLRYLAYSSRKLPVSISKLENLQALIFYHPWEAILPWEIWNSSHLRHLRLDKGCYLSDPSDAKIGGSSSLGLPNLHTLSMLSHSCCTKEVFTRIPNLRKLGILETRDAQNNGEQWSDCLDNLSYLHELKTLKYVCVYSARDRPSWNMLEGPYILERLHHLPSLKAFPPSLKKLTLVRSCLPWEDMSIIGMLPNLEVLKVKDNAFVGEEWEPMTGAFEQLKFLLMHNVGLQNWKATSIHFPSLQHLVLRRCLMLKKVPDEIGDIPTLQMIELHCCSDSAEESGRKIQQQQQSMGNDELKLYIVSRLLPYWL